MQLLRAIVYIGRFPHIVVKCVFKKEVARLNLWALIDLVLQAIQLISQLCQTLTS